MSLEWSTQKDQLQEKFEPMARELVEALLPVVIKLSHGENPDPHPVATAVQSVLGQIHRLETESGGWINEMYITAMLSDRLDRHQRNSRVYGPVRATLGGNQASKTSQVV